MADLAHFLTQLMLILATLAPIAISVFFLALAIRRPIGQGKITCFVLSAVALLPIVFIVLLGIAIQDD